MKRLLQPEKQQSNHGLFKAEKRRVRKEWCGCVERKQKSAHKMLADMEKPGKGNYHYLFGCFLT